MDGHQLCSDRYRIAIKKRGNAANSLPVHGDSIATAQVLNRRVATSYGEHRVLARYQRVIDAELTARATPDDEFTLGNLEIVTQVTKPDQAL
jgi:hypothetical protein